MLYLFEQDCLFLLPSRKTTENTVKTFQYPLYQEGAKTVFLLHYKTIKSDWLPPLHKELLEKIILEGFKYSLNDVVAYNIQEIKHSPDIELAYLPDVVFYMDKKPSDDIEKWLTHQKIHKDRIRYIPSLAQMIEDQQFKRQAWNEIKNYLNTR